MESCYESRVPSFPMSFSTPPHGQADPRSPRTIGYIYPNEIACREDRLIDEPKDGRRAIAGVPAGAPRLGLALSGGGIRSATFNLGVLQAFARLRLLRRFDYLSTVSGGGYVGSFIGAWISRDGIDAVEHELPNSRSFPVHFLRENGRYLAPNGAGDAWVALATHLRGWLTILTTLGAFFLGCLLLTTAAHEWTWCHYAGGDWPALFRRPDAAHWLWWSPWWGVVGAGVLVITLPIGAVFWLLGSKPLRLPVVFWLIVAAMLGGTLMKEVDGVRALSAALGLAIIGAAALLASWRRRDQLSALKRTLLVVEVLTLLAAAYYCFGKFEWQLPWEWKFVTAPKIVDGLLAKLHLRLPGGPVRTIFSGAVFVGGVVWAAAYFIAARHNDISRARRDLNELLALALGASATLAVLAIVDTLGGTWFALGANVKAGHAVVAAIWAAAQWAGPRLLARLEADERPSLSVTVLAGLGATFVALALLAMLSYWAHALAGAMDSRFTGGGGAGIARSLALAGAALLVLCACVGRTRTFLNLTSNLPLYTARLTRAYLGATNRLRRDPNHGGITQPLANDDLAFTAYRPDKKGGPLHVVNVTVNETVLGKSQLEQRDRHGFSFAIGPRSLTVGRTNHAIIVGDDPGFVDRLLLQTVMRVLDFVQVVRTAAVHMKERATQEPLTQPPMARTPRHVVTRVRIAPIAARPGEFHPLAAGTEPPLEQHAVEMPTVGHWMGISGAAFSTGLGQRTSLGLSFLAGIFNVRLGHWWDSGLAPFLRTGSTPLSAVGSLGVCAATVFPAQSHLLDELLARFHGPAARRLWYLSDGGHFENTAAYELIRRRVPLIVVSDCGADPAYEFEDAGGLVRKARIDFGVEIRFCDRARLDEVLTDDARRVIGTLDELKLQPADGDGPRHNTRHAALAEVFYDGADRPGSVLLLLKPTMTGDEPLDLLNYHSGHPSFPQESTLDQFFDEAQWESYRRLGELIGTEVFGEDAAALDLEAVLKRMRTKRDEAGPEAI